MSGDTKLLSAQEQLAQVDSLLEDYEQHNHILTPKYDDDIEMYLEADISKYSPDECGTAAFTLAKYAFTIQKLCNKESARVFWADETLKRVIANEAGQYEYKSYDERKILAIAGNDYALKLNKLYLEASLRVKRLNYLSQRIEFICSTLLDLQRTRRKNGQ